MIDEAFEEIVKDPKDCGKYFVVLMERRPYYGGPEEGGWWGNDNIPVRYAVYQTEEEAEAVAEKINKLAKQLTRQAVQDWGQQCADECAWLEERNLDSDFLPETDGHSTFHVFVGDSVPEPYFGERYYS